MTANFVVGQWVSGSKFYGREAEIEALLGDRRRRLWIAGLRRIGKTSLLKQLDHLSSAGACLPLFWDLQGVENLADLGFTLGEALLDAEEALTRLGIALPEVEDADPFASLEKLARALRRRGAELLLLCDEADELMALERGAPGLAALLWQAVDGFEAARVVLASSLRLCDLGTGLLKGFETPRYLGVMSDDEARSLLCQGQSPGASRPFDEAGVEAIRDHCGNHPMLLQIVAKRVLEVGDREEAFRQVAADRAVQHLFAVDFALLTEPERQVLRAPDGEVCGSAVRRLLQLGLVRQGSLGLTIPNRFLAAWLNQSPARENLIETSRGLQDDIAVDR